MAISIIEHMSEAWGCGVDVVVDEPRPDDDELIREALISMFEALPDSGPVEPWRLTDKRLLVEIVQSHRQLARVQARRLALLAEAERRDATLHEAGLPTASWITDQNTHWARSAREEVRLAVLLDAEPQVAQALASGSLSVEQAQVILRGTERLPDGLDSSQRDAVVAQLVGFGAEFGPYGLSRLVNRAVEVVAPEVAEEADRRAVERLEAEQARDRYVMWRKDDDGAYIFKAKLGRVAGQQLVGVLRALAGNERKTVLATGGEMTRLQANADALVLLATHFGSCAKLPKLGADRPKILVSVGLETLRTGLGTATLVNTGEQISAREARWLACQADILPAVMGGASVPLDVGRKKRLFTGTLRAVLIARDQGCAFPGCDRGPEECEAHHILPWYLGGRTSLSNGVMLCPFHHHLVEPNPLWTDARNWQIRLNAHGLPEFGAPVGLGAPPGQRRWRQHHRYATR